MTSYIRLFLVGLLILWSSSSRADWINLTGSETAQNIAEIYVLDDHIKVKLEVYIGDLDKFEELLPDDWLKGPVKDRPSLKQRMQIFASKRLQIIDDKGIQLPATLDLVEARMRIDRKSPFAGMINPITRQRIPDAPKDKRVLYAEITYPFNGNPQQLTIVPPQDDQGMATATIGFITYHKSVPVIDFRYLGQAAKLDLDWKDPWYTRFDNKTLSRHHRYPLMLFLYIEPRQVRLESLMRINDIEKWSNFNGKNTRTNTDGKQQRLLNHIKKHFADSNELLINGNSVKPDSVRVEFLNVTLSGVKVIDTETSIDASTVLVGVSQRYYVDKLPNSISTRWSLFNERVDRIPTIVTDPAGPFPSFIDKTSPDLKWQNFLKTYTEPAIQPVNIETGFSIKLPYIGEKKIINWPPDQQETSTIIDKVSKLSSKLATIASTEQIDILQKELAKLYSPKVSGGGVGAIQEFDDLKIIDVRELDDPDGFSATVSGSAIIDARHWGHVDRRQVEFQMLLDLIEYNKKWRIADLTVIDLKESK
jgi:hypothetical protein